MAIQSVKITNLNDGKHRVAYEMALDLWKKGHNYNEPSTTDQNDFLDLVKECMKSLNVTVSR